jgi:eukaryotic-like serine/threonine-protein kinase
MGSVFLVQHVHTDERFALKLLHAAIVKDAATLDRFRREARTPARIDSDHIVRVTDADVASELDNVPFFVMEHLRGEDLEQLARRRGPLPSNEVVVFLAQAARALDKAHALGIVHRDLKPENLFLTQREDGTPWVKILDFGIAKVTNGDMQEIGRLTTTGQIFGTPLYMSPEQAMAESEKICPQTDVWALGLIAHRLLHGKEYWTAQTLTHLVAQIAFEPMPPPSALGSTLGPSYDDWFARCCARDIPRRIKGAGEAISSLAAALAVADSPSQIGKLAVNVRVPPSNRITDERDMLAATRASDAPSSQGGDASAVTAPRPSSNLGRTQFGAEAGKPGRVPRTLGYVVAGAVASVVGAVAAWNYTAPPVVSGGTGPGARTAVAKPEPAITASVTATAPEPSVVAPPMVTPSAEVSAPPSAAPSAKVATPVTSAISKATSAPSATPSSAPSTAPTAEPTAEPTVAPVKTVDPLGTRR